MTITKAKQDLRRAIQQAGPFSHNICSLILGSVARSHGIKKANELVREFGLTAIYGIREVKKKGKK